MDVASRHIKADAMTASKGKILFSGADIITAEFMPISK
jgi:hypothetical protein